jgi:DNA-binding beta-propeller fold protein YncE
VVATPDGRWSFVTLNSAVEVLSNRSPAPVADRQVSVPGTPQGEQLTNDGRYLLVADGSGAVVIDVTRAEDGAAGAVLGTLSSPAGRGAVEVAVSPDDRFAFVTLELSGSLAVFDLSKALASGFGPADFAGTVPLGTAPVGLAVSPDGRWIYATSASGKGAATARAAGQRAARQRGHRDRPAPGRDQASRCGRRHGSRGVQPRAGGHLSGRKGRLGDR